MAGSSSYDDFVRVHSLLLLSAGLPAELHPQLFHKLSGSVFDGGSYFEIEPCEGGRQRRLLLSCPRLPRHSQVFLVDHAWSFRLPDARKQLNEIAGLAERMATLMCVGDEPGGYESEQVEEAICQTDKPPSVEAVVNSIKAEAEISGKEVLWLELDELGITDETLLELDLPTLFPNLVGLSLWGNKLHSLEVVSGTVGRLSKLRALWLNDNPVQKKMSDQLKTCILSCAQNLEIYDSQLTENYSEWAVGFCCGVYGPESPIEVAPSQFPFREVQDLDLSNRNLTTLSAKIFNSNIFPSLTYLNLRGNPLNLELTSNLVQKLKSLKSLQSLEIDIPGPLGGSALKIVDLIPELLQVNGVPAGKILEDETEILDSNLSPRLPIYYAEDPLTERVLQAMWLYIMTYRLSDEEKLDESPVWYVMDELGSALRHSDLPNFEVAPFMFLPDGTLTSAISYTLLWPTQDVMQGDECTRDFLGGIGEDKQRSSRLTAWFLTPKAYFKKAFELYWQNIISKSMKNLKGNGTGNGYGYGHSISLPLGDLPVSVYSDIPQVLDFLRRPEFILVDDPDEAQILWTWVQIRSAGEDGFKAKPHQYINQFPYESCFVMKHHLAQTIHQAHGSPSWFQPTYDMESHLAALIGDYMEREAANQDNLWIVKPWNMARTIDTTVSRSLPALIRLVETGPKICQKYIEDPALHQGKKFDLRYIVLVRSFKPFDLFLSRAFWARFSNNQYSTEEQTLLEYETHFTVMNYGGRKLNHVNTSEFVPMFEKEHNVKWADIHERVKRILRTLFEGALELHPGMHLPTARAIYGVDVMLDRNFQPKLLEVTYCPDCTRACKYDFMDFHTGDVLRGREFFNDVFGCLFLNETKNMEPL